MSYFTPIVNFDFDEQFQWKKILNVKKKYISDQEAFKYFGISNRVFDDKGRLINFKIKNINFIFKNTFSILTDLQKVRLYNSRYAFVSNLKEVTHINEIEKICNSLRLYKLNGITCPITFDNKTLDLIITYPIESKINKKIFFSTFDLIKIKELIKLVDNIPKEDFELLNLITEQGETIISLLLLIIIIEKTLMKNDSNEISFKIRLYGARALSLYCKYNDNHVYNIIDKAYKLRSKFVHEGENPESEVKKIFCDLYGYTTKIMQLNAKNRNIFKKENKLNLLLSKNKY